MLKPKVTTQGKYKLFVERKKNKFMVYNKERKLLFLSTSLLEAMNYCKTVLELR